MHPLLAFQIDLMRGFVDATVQGTMAVASGMVAMQQASERAVSAVRAPARPEPAQLPWWLPSAAMAAPTTVPASLAMFNPLLAWQQALTQSVAPTAFGPLGGAGTVEVKVAVRSASGHAMALGIEMPMVPFPRR